MAPSNSRKRPTRPSSHRKGPKVTVATKAKTAPGAASTSNSMQASTSYVPHSSLKWSTVHVPTEALSGGAGTTDSTFFQGFSFDDDDFMGLQEVDDVDVEFLRTKDGGKTIKFKAAQDKVKGANGKRKQQEDEPERRQREEGDDDGERNEEAVELQESLADQRKKPKRSRTDDEAGAAINQTEGDEGEYVSPFLAEEEIAGGGDKDESGPEDDEEPASATDAAASDNDPDDDDLAVAFSKVPSADIDLYDDDEDDDAEGDEQDNEFDETLLPGWSSIPLHPELKRGLFNMKFIQPTEIQARSLPPALGLGLASTGLDASSAEDSDEEEEEESSTIGVQRDVIGVSQTGSGKTLAYGLPILQWLFHNAPGSIPMPSVAAGSDDEGTDSLPTPLGALVLTPTRELALQVAAHLSDVIKASCRSSPTDAAVSKRKLSRRPHIAVICGGMSEQKQRRLLEGQSRKSGGADIIVATPGRLWEMARLDDHLAARIKRTRFLVLDEADRMVEVGHFAEMEHILKLVSRDGAEAPEDDANEEQEEEGKDGVLTSGVRPSENMQTFVFSATLSKALQINLKKRKRAQVFSKKKGKGGRKAAEATTLDDLMDRVDFRDARPYLVDLTRGQGLPAGLIETKLECLHTDKDLYLYYFLLRYPGRTLVFVNSIDGIRRLHPILTNLQLRVFPLHSQLQQKQRLKNLDRFRATQLSRAASADQKMAAAASALEPASLGGSSSVLLATDVAARGLDIPAVDHVVHYQLPRSADSYVHRSGRTARAGGTGVALALVEPKEKKLWSNICRALRKKQDTLTLPVTYSLLPHLRNRLTLARTIDAKHHVSTKAAHEDSWLRTLAAEAELDFAPLDGSDAEDTGASSGGRKAKQHQAEVRDLRAQLEAALRQPLFQRGSSKRYITAATAANRDGLASALIGSNNHESVLGLESSSLQADLQSLSSKRDTSDKKKSLAAKAPASVAVTAKVPATPSVVPTPTTAKVTAKAKAKKLTPTQQQKRKAKQLAQQVLKQKRAKLLAAAAANAA